MQDVVAACAVDLERIVAANAVDGIQHLVVGVIDFLMDVGIHLFADARNDLIHARKRHAEAEGVAYAVDGAETVGERVALRFRIGHEYVMRIRYPAIAFLNRTAHGLLHILAGTGKARRGQRQTQHNHENIFHSVSPFFSLGFHPKPRRGE